MVISKNERGVILLLQRLLKRAVNEKDIEGEDLHKENPGREKLSGVRSYFRARCEVFEEENGGYYIPETQYLPFIVNGTILKGEEYPLVKGEYQSLDQLVNFHVSLQRYGFRVNQKWTHNLDGSLIMSQSISVSSLHYWKRLLDFLQSPIIWNEKRIDKPYSCLTKVNGDGFVLKIEEGCTLKFGHIDELIALQSFLKDPAVKWDFELLRSFDATGSFTVGSGTYLHLLDYKSFMETAKKENVACIHNHSLNGSFELVSGNVQGVFKSWEQYRNPAFHLEQNMVKVNRDGSFLVILTPNTDFVDNGFNCKPNKEFEEKKWSVTSSDDNHTNEKHLLSNLRTTRISGFFKDPEEFFSFREACINQKIKIARHISAYEFCTPEGTFKSIEQYVHLRESLNMNSTSLDNVFGHRTCGTFHMLRTPGSYQQDFDYTLHIENPKNAEDLCYKNVRTGEIVHDKPTEGKIEARWHCSKKVDGSGFEYRSVHDGKIIDSMPDKFWYPESDFTVRYDRWAGTMFWSNCETNESYSKPPPDWQGPIIKVRSEMHWDQPMWINWWAIVMSELKVLRAADVLGLHILDTQLADIHGLNLNICCEIANFLVREFEVGERVLAQYHGDTWYDGKITMVNNDRKTFAVEYKMGLDWDKCPGSKISRMQVNARMLSLGDVVEAQYREDGRWDTGVVTAVIDNGETFTVRCAEGEFQCSPAKVRRRFSVGELVWIQDTGFYRGIIANMGDGDHFRLLMEKGHVRERWPRSKIMPV